MTTLKRHMVASSLDIHRHEHEHEKAIRYSYHWIILSSRGRRVGNGRSRSSCKRNLLLRRLGPGRRVSTPWDQPVRYSAEGVELVCGEVGEGGAG